MVAIRLAIPGSTAWTYPDLASALCTSASEAHAAVKRAAKSGLIDEKTRTPRKSPLLEFLVHAVRYLFPPVWTGVTRGVPTSYAVAPSGHTPRARPVARALYLCIARSRMQL